MYWKLKDMSSMDGHTLLTRNVFYLYLNITYEFTLSNLFALYQFDLNCRLRIILSQYNFTGNSQLQPRYGNSSYCRSFLAIYSVYEDLNFISDTATLVPTFLRRTSFHYFWSFLITLHVNAFLTKNESGRYQNLPERDPNHLLRDFNLSQWRSKMIFSKSYHSRNECDGLINEAKFLRSPLIPWQ